MQQLSERQLQTHNRLKDDYSFYAKNFLKIASKAGPIVPFHFTMAQQYIHDRLEEQKKKTGMVRAYVVKARQVRCSSYTQGRFFHDSAYIPNTKSFILTHRDDATDNLFGMAKTFLDQLNEKTPTMAPEMISATGHKMVFKNGSRYGLGTAASPNVGRSMTVQRFHGSEVAFWQYSDEIQTGILQTIADVPGTEIIFESTANGPRGMFHQGVMDVLSGKNRKFIVVFVPWFWEDIYKIAIPKGMKFFLDEDEQHLKDTHELSDEQLLWRRDKIVEMGALWKFKQEYPANVIEAFQSSEAALIDPDAIDIARKCNLTDASAPIIMGIDPASSKDRHPFVIRQGRHLIKIYDHEAMEGTKATHLAINYIKKHNVDQVFIDTTKDLSLYDQLRALGYKDMVIKIHFNQKPNDSDRFVNKRAEMVYGVKEWVEDNGVNIPDDDSLHAELSCVPHEEITANGKIFFISKKQIIKDYGMSPDIYDALALTFAYPVRRALPAGVEKFAKVKANNSSSPIGIIANHRNRPEKKQQQHKKEQNIIRFRSAK